MDTPISERPCALPGRDSYRAKGPFGWVMMGARNASQARRMASSAGADPSTLELWEGDHYAPAKENEQ